MRESLPWWRTYTCSQHEAYAKGQNHRYSYISALHGVCILDNFTFFLAHVPCVVFRLRGTFTSFITHVPCVMLTFCGNFALICAHVRFLPRSQAMSYAAATGCQGFHWMNYLEAIPLYRWGIENTLQPFQSGNKRSVCGHDVTQRSALRCSPTASHLM
jgi:hypothetical protein